MSISPELFISILTNLLGLAFVTEAVVQILKTVFNLVDDRVIFGISVITGIVTSIATSFSLFGGVGIQAWAGMVLAGILVSRGGNYLHEVIKILESLSGSRVSGVLRRNK